jgi:hypothetical protein
MLWVIAVVLAVLWFLGFFIAHVGDLIHLLLVLAVISIIYHFVVARNRGTSV